MTDKRVQSFLVDEDDGGERLDSFLSGQMPALSRSRLQKAIRAGEVTVEGVAVLKPSQKVRQQERVEVAFSPPRPLEIVPEKIPLDIVYEDEHLLVVNKAPGMVVHPAPGHETGTLVHALLGHCTNLSGIGGVLRPGIVHRLDAGTSGLLVVAKSDEIHIALSRQLMERSMHRIYIALVWGEMPEHSGVIDMPIGRSPRDRKKMTVIEGGREALTTYSVVDTYSPFQYIKLKLGTGRTHQIRVHLSRVGHPVLGDPLYGGRTLRRGMLTGPRAAIARKALSMIDRQALHAEELSFVHPGTGAFMTFTAPPPDDLRAVLDFLRAA